MAKPDPKKVKALLKELGVQGSTLSDMEKSIERLKETLGKAKLEMAIEELGSEDTSPKPCPKCGRKIKVNKKNQSRTLHTLSGEQTFVRNYHYCQTCKFGFHPRDDVLGLPQKGDVSFELERRLLDFVLHGPPAQCENRWDVHYPVSFSSGMFRNVLERAGERIEQCDEDLVQRSCRSGSQKPAELLYAMNDGSMVSTHGGWKETKLGGTFREAHHVQGTSSQRGVVSQARYTAILGEQSEFKESMKALLDVENWRRAGKIVWLGDGAKGNWTLAEEVAPTAIQILDFQHAVEHAMNCAKALLGEGSDCLPAWQSRIEELLLTESVDTLISEIMQAWNETDNPFATKAISQLVQYYRNNEKRMDYRTYLANGWMIGSGFIESAHRHVVQARMKLAGQHWSLKGGKKMAKLRAALATAGPKKGSYCRQHSPRKNL